MPESPSFFSLLLRIGTTFYFAGVALGFWLLLAVVAFPPGPQRPPPLRSLFITVMAALLTGGMAAVLTFGAFWFGLGYGRARVKAPKRKG
jgi:hypothetical protein